MKDFYIDRVQIEGGFLDGLDLRLRTGLNAVIGARGTGKSTLVELIRFCLGVKGQTSESTSRSVSHARAVLRDGQITITLSNGDENYRFSRSVDSDTTPTIPDGLNLPLIFSQTEVETIGLLPAGRLGIIDNFIRRSFELRESEISFISQVESYSDELVKLASKENENEDKVLVLPGLLERLKDFEEEEKKVIEVSEKAAEKSQVLKNLTNEYIERSKVIDSIKSILTANKKLIESTRTCLDSNMYEFPESLRGNQNIEYAVELRARAIGHINEGFHALYELNEMFANELSVREKEQEELTRRGQAIRKEVDQYKEGAGELSRKMQNLKSEISRVETIKSQNSDVKNRISKVKDKRNTALDHLERVRGEITQLRQEVCDKLNRVLNPKIRVKLEQLSQVEEYGDVLIGAMKGSGIRYNDLAPIISQAIPPRVLLDIVESNDVDEFVALTSVTKDRAFKVLSALSSSLDKIATVRLEDEVSFELLDGTEYKGFNDLSTGQRCTVILPIILEHQDTVLVIDQPEDHIDNAFIVDTLISSIQRRAETAQIIVTTHNANIPVLGRASEVIHLNSDGTRGYVINEGELDSPNIVEAISNVMEGGKAAFKRRAEFYG